jgi:hypothetical protein
MSRGGVCAFTKAINCGTLVQFLKPKEVFFMKKLVNGKVLVALALAVGLTASFNAFASGGGTSKAEIKAAQKALPDGADVVVRAYVSKKGNKRPLSKGQINLESIQTQQRPGDTPRCYFNGQIVTIGMNPNVFKIKDGRARLRCAPGGYDIFANWDNNRVTRKSGVRHFEISAGGSKQDFEFTFVDPDGPATKAKNKKNK